MDADFPKKRVKFKSRFTLKTKESKRSIRITRAIQESLDRQKELTAGFDSPYVFLNNYGSCQPEKTIN